MQIMLNIKFYIMKNLIISALLLFAVSFSMGQDSKVVSAFNYRKPQYYQLDKAKQAIDEASVHEKTMLKPKTWYYRGLIYQDIAVTTDQKFKDLDPKPLTVALQSYLKALLLDSKKSLYNEIILQLTQMSVLLINKGIEDFNQSSFELALENFENSLRIDSLPDLSRIDTMTIFNAGVAADKAKNYDKALKYYSLAASYKYEGPKVYTFIGNIYKEKGDTLKAVQTLKDGIASFPENNATLMVELINFYLQADKTGEALEYLNLAIQNDPSNYSYYFARGTLYDKMKDFENAKISYEKSIELNKDYFDAYYNLGALFYNKAVELIKVANDIPAKEQKRYDETINNAKEQLKLAMPFLEKANELDPNEMNTLLSLKEIYVRLALYDKANAVKAKIEELKQ